MRRYVRRAPEARPVVVRGSCGWLVLVFVAGVSVACARGPVVAPTGDWLADWLAGARTARAIRSAAESQNWLSGESVALEDLRAAMRSVGVVDRDGLETTLGRRNDDVELMLAALRLRRPGTVTGDLAHWVAASLLVFSERAPEVDLIPQGARWDADYVANLFELRELVARGTLALASRPVGFDGTLPPSNLSIELPTLNGGLAARQDLTNWPVYAAPGTLAVRGLASFTAGETIHVDAHRWIIQRSGRARGRTEYVRTVPFYRILEDGSLEIAGGGNFAVAADQEVTVLMAEQDGSRLWVWMGDGRVGRVPSECCHTPDNVQSMLWVQLGTGEHAGGWTNLPTDAFEQVSWSTLMARQPARPPSQPLTRLGEFGRAPSFTATVAGAELVAWRDGDPEAEPLFVLHGGPGFGSAYLREPLTELLGDSLQLFFYDQRGSGYAGGLSDPDGLTMRRLVDDLELLRRRAGLEQLDLMGHSFGGLLAMHYAIAYPERTRTLVLVDSDPATYEEWMQFVPRLQARLAVRLSDGDRTLMESIRAIAPADLKPEQMTALLGLRMRGYTARTADADAIDFALSEAVLPNLTTTPRLIRTDLGEWDLTEQLDRIRARTLVIAGADSIFPVEAAEALGASIPDARLVVMPSVGHFPWVEDPDGFRAAVLEFMTPR